MTWSSSRSRTVSPGHWPTASTTTCSSSTAAPTSAWPTRSPGRTSTTHRTRVPGRTGCPSCRGAGRRCAVPGASRCQASPQPPGSRALPPPYAAGLAEPDAVIVAASGPSGAGRSPKPHLLGSEVLGSVSAYGVGGVHRHTPEIVQSLSAVAGEPITVSFTPMLAPMSRGILATCTAKAKPGGTAAALRAAYTAAFAAEPFAELMPPDQWPATSMTLGSNVALVQVALDERAGRIVAGAAIHHLTKGTARGAGQCANLALGLPEELGLSTLGVAP